MDISGKQEHLQKIIHETANELGYMIYESSILLKGEQSKLVVKLDKVDGISHNDCTVYTRVLVKRLDTEKVLPNYSLEISSPGLGRKLRNIDEFKRFRGSLVKIVYDSDDITKVIKGIINNIIDTKIEVKSDNGEFIIDFEKIKKANIEY